MKTHSYPNYTYCLLFCLQAVSQAADVTKAYNNTALNQTASWTGGVLPGTGDVILWNNTFLDGYSAATAMSPIGADLSVQGIKITNVGGAVNQANRFIGFQDPAVSPNPASFYKLTLGSGGIDMSAATQALFMQSKITLGADQTWNILNANTNTNTSGGPAGFNNGEDIALQALATNTPIDFGTRTLTTTGTGHVTVTSGYALSNGTLNVGNALIVLQGGNSRATSIAASLTTNVNAGTLRLQANSAGFTGAGPISVNNGGILEIFANSNAQTVVQSGAVTLNTGGILGFLQNTAGMANNSVSAVNVAGNATIRVSGSQATTAANFSSITGNITGSGAITYQNTATGAASGFVRLTGNNSGYTGTITVNGASGNRTLRLANANAGSAAATWNVAANNTLQIDGLSVQLGNLQGSGILTNSSTTALATANIDSGEFSGTITNGASQPTAINKTGSGLLRLTGANTYTGATTVSAGTLVASPDQTGLTPVTVADNATYSVLNKGSGATLNTGNVTIGATTGGTLQLDYGTGTNPFSPLLSAGTLTFNGPSTLKIVGSNLTPGTFPLIQYTSYAGTAVSGLNLILPTRTIGSLTNSGSQVSLTISSTEKVKWNGDLSDNWDIDPTGSGGAGTANWKTTVTNASTRYIQGSAGTDSVNFDDTATGSGTVNLTTTLAPLDIVVNNSTKNYTFTGSGSLTGFAHLTKSGTGTLTIANTTANTYAGGTIIEAGTIRLGDGVTAGAGQITGTIDNSGTLVINRPDDHSFTATLTGLGTLEKAQASTATIPASATLNGPLILSGGKLRFTGGGAINDVVSGNGQLEAGGGTLTITGATANTNTGLTTVSAGTLQLSKSATTNAIGGDLTISGTGVLNTFADEQIPDTATISALGSSADSFPGTPGKETFANAIVNGTSAATQLILRNNANVTNTATVTQGILGVASNNTVTVNAVVMTAPTAILRVAGGSNPSVMNIGPGGITASAGDVQVKFNTAEFDATLNLSGNVTTTGNFAFTNGGYTGAKLNAVRLDGSRIFNIGAGTLTTIAPDIANFINSEAAEVPGTLIKNGDGSLVLDASSSATHTGGTVVNAGALRVHGSLAGTVQVNSNAIIGGNGTLSGAVTVDGTVSPGTSGAPAIGHLHSTGSLAFTPGSDYLVEIGNWAGTTAGTDWDHLSAGTLAFTAIPSNKLVIHVGGTPTGFTETNKTIAIATASSAVTGFDASAIQIDATGFPGAGTWAVQLTGSVVELVYTASAASAYSAWATAEGLTPANNDPAADPDNDGQTNLVEFALNSTALSGANSGKLVGKIGSVGGQQAQTITLPVRTGVAFTGTTELTGTADGVRYRIQASDALSAWTLAVTEVTGADATAIQTGLPSPLPTGWAYRTFRSPGAVVGDPSDFLRVVIEPNP